MSDAAAIPALDDADHEVAGAVAGTTNATVAAYTEDDLTDAGIDCKECGSHFKDCMGLFQHIRRKHGGKQKDFGGSWLLEVVGVSCAWVAAWVCAWLHKWAAH